MDSFEYRDDINYWIDFYNKEMPESIKRDIYLANHDLYLGPVYLDADDEIVSCFDEWVKQFDFVAACRRIQAWCERHVSPLQMEVWYDDETDTAKYETVEGSDRDILRGLLGDELVRTIW